MTALHDIYIWYNGHGECPVNFLPEFIYQRGTTGKEHLGYAYDDKSLIEKRKEILNDFNSVITDYFTTHTCTINSDIPISNNVNIILVPCVDFLMLLHSITAISQHVYNFCEQYNIKICFNYIRECVTIVQQKKINEYIEKFYCKKGYNKKYIKIIINAFKPIENDMFISINMFDKFLFNKNNKQNNQSIFLQKRKYKFSTLIGQLYQRFHRVHFLYECKKNNLIDESFFYSVININCEDTRKFIQDVLTPEKYNEIKDLVHHRVFNSKGNLLEKHDHIYNDGYEYDTPIQVFDSYIHIVLETDMEMPCVTEKIYKPILCGIPFLWLGYKNISNHLIRQGYKLYPFINYEFDSGETIDNRFNMLIKEIIRLSSINLEYWINDTRDIALHNIKNFLTQQYTMNELHNQLKYE